MADRSAVHALLDAADSVVTGQSVAIRTVLAAILGGGHVLIEDQPGVGKSLLVKALSRLLGLDSERVQGTEDLYPSDITGVEIFDPQSSSWVFHPGPVFSQLVFVDELNRATPKAQTALLEAMGEGHVSVGGITHSLPHPFTVVATQNPSGEVGTVRLYSA